jgi:hypothetical protein
MIFSTWTTKFNKKNYWIFQKMGKEILEKEKEEEIEENKIKSKTKIVCTLGPASETEEVLEKMIMNGMNVARLNFSHGDHESQYKRFETIRNLSKKLNKNVSIICDIQGPKIR